MKIVYIAAPYRGKNTSEIDDNIQFAAGCAKRVWSIGHIALCPHTNSAYFDGVTTQANFLNGDLLLLEKCDILWVAGDVISSGVRGEIEFAMKHDMKIVYSFHDLCKYLKVECDY